MLTELSLIKCCVSRWCSVSLSLRNSLVRFFCFKKGFVFHRLSKTVSLVILEIIVEKKGGHQNVQQLLIFFFAELNLAIFLDLIHDKAQNLHTITMPVIHKQRVISSKCLSLSSDFWCIATILKTLELLHSSLSQLAFTPSRSMHVRNVGVLWLLSEYSFIIIHIYSTFIVPIRPSTAKHLDRAGQNMTAQDGSSLPKLFLSSDVIRWKKLQAFTAICTSVLLNLTKRTKSFPSGIIQVILFLSPCISNSRSGEKVLKLIINKRIKLG